MPIDVISFIGTIGSLSSMVSLYLSLTKDKEEISEQDRRNILEASNIGRAQASIEEFDKVIAIIPAGIRDAILGRIKRAEEKFADVIKDVNNGKVVIDQAWSQAAYEICNFIKMYMSHNKGRLDNKDLEELWEAFNCSP